MKPVLWALALLTASLVRAEVRPPPSAVTEATYLYEVVRHLYRWHLDERDVEPVPGVTQMEFRVRALTPELDEGDRSEFAEIVLPALRCRVLVKRPDYTIEETGTPVQGRGFRIYRVSREDAPEEISPGTVRVGVRLDDLRGYLFRTRAQTEYPEPALVERLHAALRSHAVDEGWAAASPGPKVVYFAPLSPVSNEWWVYGEERKLLIRFSSDIDLTNPAVWDHERIVVDTWDAYRQVVVSTEEAPGSNEFLTRDQIGRALYNCLVLGRREVLSAAPPPSK